MMKMMDKILNNYPLTSMHGLEYNPCKQEDFRNLSDDLNIDEEALFFTSRGFKMVDPCSCA